MMLHKAEMEKMELELDELRMLTEDSVDQEELNASSSLVYELIG